jgi:hypothetical protein
VAAKRCSQHAEQRELQFRTLLNENGAELELVQP